MPKPTAQQLIKEIEHELDCVLSNEITKLEPLPSGL